MYQWSIAHSHALTRCVCSSFRLVADKDIYIWQKLLELDLEELGNERRGQVKGDHLKG